MSYFFPIVKVSLELEFNGSLTSDQSRSFFSSFYGFRVFFISDESDRAEIFVNSKSHNPALYCYSAITGVIGYIPFFKQGEMVVEGGLKKSYSPRKYI